MIKTINKIKHRITRFRNRGANKSLILMYHRVASFLMDPQLLSVSSENFERQLNYLKEEYQPIHLSELCTSLENRSIDDKSIVITFDDGYIDNFFTVLPLLQKYKIPATIFVTTGFIDANLNTPSDILEQTILNTNVKATHLCIKFHNKTLEWDLNEIGEVFDTKWNVLSYGKCTSRQKCYLDLHKLLFPLSLKDRTIILEQLQAWAGENTFIGEKKILEASFIEKLSSCKLIEIGSHGVDHLALSKQPSDIQIYEIGESKKKLEAIINKPVRYFAYPYGGDNAVNIETIKIVQQMKYHAACSTKVGTTTLQSNLFQLPRFCVRNWNERQFANEVERMFKE